MPRSWLRSSLTGWERTGSSPTSKRWTTRTSSPAVCGPGKGAVEAASGVGTRACREARCRLAGSSPVRSDDAGAELWGQGDPAVGRREVLVEVEPVAEGV